MGAGGGHAGVQLGFVHLPSPRAPQPPFRGCFLLKLPQSQSHCSKGGSRAERWPSESCLPASVFASVLCEGTRSRLNLPSEPLTALLPACCRQEPRPSALHVPCPPGVEGVPRACSDLRAAQGRQRATDGDAQGCRCGHISLLTCRHGNWKPSCRTEARTHVGPRGPAEHPSLPPPPLPRLPRGLLTSSSGQCHADGQLTSCLGA